MLKLKASKTTSVKSIPQNSAVSTPDTASVHAMYAKLILLRPGHQRREYPLTVGTHIIGRKDQCAADIDIPDDPGISRESAKIEVTDEDGQLYYQLTALNATNPILHNYTPLAKGRSIMLNYGDSIMLGHTKLRFERARK